MKRLIARAFLITVVITFFSAGQSNASNFIGDIEIFKDCSVAIPANVLFLMDTSASMMSQDIIYYQGAQRFSHDGDYSAYGDKSPDKVYYYNGTSWVRLCSKDITKEEIKCSLHREQLLLNGHSVGPLVPCSTTCSNTTLTEYTLATGRYVNYLKYLDHHMENVTYTNSDYDPNVDYGVDGYDGVKMDEPRERNRLYYNDGVSILPLCLTAHKYVGDIHCAAGVQCDHMAAKKLELETKGFAKNVYIDPCILWWGAAPYYLYTGNFLNHMELKFGRRYVAIRAIKKAVRANPDLRYGIMQFDLDFAGSSGVPLWKNDGGDLALPCDSPDATYSWKGTTKTHSEMMDIILDGGWEGDANQQYMQPLYFGKCTGNACEAKWTPLAESLVEAGLYFAGEDSWFNEVDGVDKNGKTITVPRKYSSPIICPDQKSFVIILTDGKPHYDFTYLIDNHKWILHWKDFPLPSGDTPIGDYDGDEEDKALIGYKETWVDDVAKFLFDNDLSALGGDENENIVVYPIGLDLGVTELEVDHFLLQDTADNGQGFTANSGNGVYFKTRDEDEIVDALNKVLSITENFTFTFSSAATPISITDSIYSGNDVFTTGFQLKAGHRGEGNITKYVRSGYKIQGNNSSGTLTDLFNASGDLATGVVDLWAPSNPDCSADAVPCSGAAYMLKHALDGVTVDPADSIGTILTNVAAVRTLKTAHGAGTSWTTVELTDSAVIGASPSIEIQKEGGETYSGDDLKRFLVKKAYGLGLDWPLGDVLHSNLVVAQYPDSDGREHTVTPYIFSGHNDGMLHCFDASDGSEVWGFIPPDIFKARLNDLRTPSVGNWFVDGKMALYYHTDNHTSNAAGGGGGGDGGTPVDGYDVKKPQYLIFGERRGGTSYHVLDVSLKNSPSYEFPIGGTSGWGQSWSKPKLCQVKTSEHSTVKKCVLVGGGYDVNQDALYPGDDSDGKFISIYYLTGAKAGKELVRFPKSGEVTIEACVVGASIIDHDHDTNRVFSRVYAGDLEGNVYHFADDLAVGIDGSVGASTVDGNWHEHHLFDAQDFSVTVQNEVKTIHQKIFYSPIMGYACDEKMVFFGTGDREHPMRKDMTDSIYGVKDHWSGSSYTKDNLIPFNLAPNPGGRTVGGITEESYTISDCIDACGGVETCEAVCNQRNSGWYFDFPQERYNDNGILESKPGEKMISEPLIVGNHMIFGSYTPPDTVTPATLCDTGTCVTGDGRIYVVSSCANALVVKSYKLKDNPMPQPSLIFDEDSGEVFINTGSGRIIDPDLPVIVPDYWKHSGAAL